jgi:two-component system response regulator ChvI
MLLSSQHSASTLLPPAASAESLRPTRVIAVDDDAHFREMLRAELTEHGFSVETFADAQSLLAAVHDIADADVILLDWGLPRVSGIDLLLQLRRLGIALPAVFLTGRPFTSNESLAFDHGALDFIDKARGISILVQRLRLVAGIKTPETLRERFLQCGKLLLKPHVSRAFWNDTDVQLTLGEFKIVHLLARNAGHHVTYRDIYDCLHYRGFIAGTGENGYRTNVRSAIKRIRGKFRAYDPSFAEIENYTAFGYVWGRGCGSGSS